MNKKQDAQKAGCWRRTIRETAGSGVSIREFRRPGPASFALFGNEALAGGRRLRIGKGVDQAALRAGLAVAHLGRERFGDWELLLSLSLHLDQKRLRCWQQQNALR